MEGIIFDRQRFALHDGPGIRTVIFLKGCPLACRWCSNPESIKLQPQLSFAEETCRDTGACKTICPENVFTTKFWVPKISFDKCNACGKCVANCPSGALKIYGYRITSSDIIAEVIRDKEFYDNSGGGLTLSGGEPLFQPDFSFDILSKAKNAGIHTCIETSGYAGEKTIRQMLPVTDLFLFDYKMTDDSQHQYYTGVSNRRIIENLKLVLSAGGRVILRCIIIPGLNDTEEHFRAIAALSGHKHVEMVELMPYHLYGKHKYKQLGMEPFEFGVKTTDPKLAALWAEEISHYGCEKIKTE